MTPQRISVESIRQASRWMARLWADDVTDDDKRAFDAWRTESPDNESAWQQLTQLQGQFAALPKQASSRRILMARRGVSRRRLLSLAAMGLLTAGLVAVKVLHHTPRGQVYATAVGEIRKLTLSDGTELVLNTDTEIYVDFNPQARHLTLEQGEVMIQSGHHLTPLTLTSLQGQVTPIGTRFSVRQREGRTEVKVQEGQVRLSPSNMKQPQLLSAGQWADFSDEAVSAVKPLPEYDASWVSHRLVARRMPLTTLVNELSRYRTGFLRVDPQLAELSVTGVFDLDNPDQVLRQLEKILPIQARFLTRYWVTVIPASSP
ncbi:FecR domain-containing protein [Photobacterium halotolerans]|uniref:FecR domain-containing protein n=1 Tax=Photobacterium halotolerans TaxID=265726 RepID=UPI0013723FC8|nr:FecR domain-containing protein [Photobacterium halotolerans]NAW87335.1 DUF4880 domain-containing protein [Photobacterium halotolerans]